jgi:undecaprenyl-diphosphatase
MMSVMLALFGLVLYLTSRNKNFDQPLDQMKKPQHFKAILIGLAQGLAVIPGVSRSGITLSASMFLKFRLIIFN